MGLFSGKEKKEEAEIAPEVEATGTRGSDGSSGKVEGLEDGPGAFVQPVSKLRERQILRKLDMRIVPMVMWVYLMNMTDRGMFTHCLHDSRSSSLA